jgi:high affinity Mn2+ porin
MKISIQSILICVFSIGINSFANAQITETTPVGPWSFHFQQTVIMQAHNKLAVPYSGLHSLQSDEGIKSSLTSTMFIGRKLWKGAAVYVNPEIAGGEGLSGALGVAGFVNGETFRIGEPKPALYIGRAYIKQHISLGGNKIALDNGANQIQEEISEKGINLIFGKFAISDFMDNNGFSHDPRSQFFNWSLMSNGAWDYSANTRGYTWGGVIEYYTAKWAVRYGIVLEPKEANGQVLDTNVTRQQGQVLEIERKYTLGGKKGTVRIMAFFNNAMMGNYKQATKDTAIYHLDITQTRNFGRSKYGFGINMEQQLTDEIGMFARTSWNDGHNETWAFTEIDNSVSIGFVSNMSKYKRPNDKFGIAFVSNGISEDHKNYIAAGGLGFIIGDGKLNYTRENILETYYSARITDAFFLSLDYQFVANPAYNKDRGVVNVLGIRGHIEF